MVFFLYNVLIIPVLRILVRCTALFNPKLREREDSWDTTLELLSSLPPAEYRVWFHVASMGEFEQAKPIIEHLKAENPDISIIVSFFSPSGYRHQKHYPLADAVVYMPLDTSKKARQFVTAISPNAAVFIRYELWLNHLAELSKKKIPVYLWCATFPRKAIWNFPFFKGFLQKTLGCFTQIYTVGEDETELFVKANRSLAVHTAADTRFDRIISVIEKSKDDTPIIPNGYFKPDDTVLVAGSTWQKDEEIIIESLNALEQTGQIVRMIIVPHEPTQEHIATLKNKLLDSVLLSELTEKNSNKKHIIVDSMGKLLKLYRYAHIVYVGGGFGAGVHSTAEPAGYGVPLVCGEHISRSPDAQNLENLGALTCVSSSKELIEWLLKMTTDKDERSKRGNQAKEYVYRGAGGSKAAAEIIANNLNVSCPEKS